ncbi:unnamed protein product, partial [Brenthis ino]
MNENNKVSDVSNAGVVFNDNISVRPLSSEVGCPPTSAGHSDNTGYAAEHVSTEPNTTNITTEFFVQMMQTMQQMSEKLMSQQYNKVKINDIFLPSYDPDGSVGIREWCQHISKAIDKYKLDDYDIRMKVGSLLKGRAKLWVDNWLISTNSWDELRENLISTFEPENRYSRDIVKFREHSYDHNKDISEFLSQAWVLWRRITKDKLGNDDAVEAVIGCIKDEHLRIELLNVRAESVPELISVASSIRSSKKRPPTEPGTQNYAALKRTVHLFGTPNQVIVDGGREFLGDFKVYCDNVGINIHTISPGTSRANGQVERMVGTLKNGLIMINNYETEEWPVVLDSLQLAFNCTPQSTTGVAPLTLLTRRKNCVPPELFRLVNFENQTIDMEQLYQHVQQRMLNAAEKEKIRFNKNKAKIRPFQKGDYVLIKNNPRNQTCLDLKYSEPYEVCRILDNDRYMVKKVIGKGRPRKVAHDQMRLAPQPGQQAAVSAGTEVVTSQSSRDNSLLDPQPSTSSQIDA